MVCHDKTTERMEPHSSFFVPLAIAKPVGKLGEEVLKCEKRPKELVNSTTPFAEVVLDEMELGSLKGSFGEVGEWWEPEMHE